MPVGNSQLLESGAGPLVLAHLVFPDVLALSLSLARQAGGDGSVPPHDPRPSCQI